MSSQSTHGIPPSGQQFDLCGTGSLELNEKFENGNAGTTNNDDSNFGGIVIPNEYGIGF